MSNVFDSDAFDEAVAALKKRLPAGKMKFSTLDVFLKDLTSIRMGDGKFLPIAEEVLSRSAEADEALDAVATHILGSSSIDPNMRDVLMHLVKLGTNYGMALQRANDEKSKFDHNSSDVQEKINNAKKVMDELFPNKEPVSRALQDLFTVEGSLDMKALLAAALDMHDGLTQGKKPKKNSPAVVADAGSLSPVQRAKTMKQIIAEAEIASMLEKNKMKSLDRLAERVKENTDNVSVAGGDTSAEYSFSAEVDPAKPSVEDDNKVIQIKEIGSSNPLTIVKLGNSGPDGHLPTQKELESYHALFEDTKEEDKLAVESQEKKHLTLEYLDDQLKHTNDSIQQLATAVATLAKSLAHSKS